MFALAKQAFPMREYLQANGGSRRLTDEETDVCTVDKTSVPSFIIKIGNFRRAVLLLLTFT